MDICRNEMQGENIEDRRSNQHFLASEEAISILLRDHVQQISREFRKSPVIALQFIVQAFTAGWKMGAHHAGCVPDAVRKPCSAQ